LIDLLVAGCYQALPSKRHFEAFCMLYFAAATSYERRSRESGNDISSHQIFLAEDQKWVAVVQEAYEQISQTAKSQNWGEPATFESYIREKIKPYNHVGLCDPQMASMYRYTALL
jgi:FADH2 O2-dependent halogenase